MTALHFGISPKKPPGKRSQKQVIPGPRIRFRGPKSAFATVSVYKPYTITLEIKKGRRVPLRGKYDTKPFLASSNNSPMIPFQRMDKSWRDADVIHTTSVPQMIGSPKVRKQIESRINDDVRKRLDHHLERFTK